MDAVQIKKEQVAELKAKLRADGAPFDVDLVVDLTALAGKEAFEAVGHVATRAPAGQGVAVFLLTMQMIHATAGQYLADETAKVMDRLSPDEMAKIIAGIFDGDESITAFKKP